MSFSRRGFITATIASIVAVPALVAPVDVTTGWLRLDNGVWVPEGAALIVVPRGKASQVQPYADAVGLPLVEDMWCPRESVFFMPSGWDEGIR